MSMMTDIAMTRVNRLLSVMVIAIALLVVSMAALGKPPHDRPPENRPPEVNNAAGSVADADATAAAAGIGVGGGASVSTGPTSADGGDSAASADNSVVVDSSGSPVSASGGEANGSVSNISRNESNFFAFSTGFPQASGCFKGTQGGGGGDGGAGFLGFHWLDHNCWMSQLAAAEADAEVRALLKCGSKKFRNAIAFREPRNERQEFCVNYMVEKHLEEIAAMQAEVDAAVASGDLSTDPK